MTLRTTAPGKVNLCLFVGEPRPDGYHPIVSLFQSVSLADTIKLDFTKGTDPFVKDEVICPGVAGPNLAAKALAAYRAATGWDGPPVRVVIEKRVPVAAGMGGGSGDAAAVLRLVAEAAGEPVPAGLALSLGADVPFQLVGGRALVTGIGERVAPLPPGPPDALVIYPSEHRLATPAVYAEADRLATTRDARALAVAEADVRAGALPSVNDLQDAARSLCPSIDRALEQLLRAGADSALVAGSGPTVFGSFDDRERAAAVAAVLPGAVAVEPL